MGGDTSCVVFCSTNLAVSLAAAPGADVLCLFGLPKQLATHQLTGEAMRDCYGPDLLDEGGISVVVVRSVGIGW